MERVFALPDRWRGHLMNGDHHLEALINDADKALVERQARGTQPSLRLT